MKVNSIPVPLYAPQIGGVYRHYKGDLYKVVALALHASDDVWMVVYEPLYVNPSAPVFTRSLVEWVEYVDWNGQLVQRFYLVADS